MKKIIFFIFIICLSFQVSWAQDKDTLGTQLVGTWHFDEVTMEEEVEAEKLEMLTSMMKNVKMVYETAGRYKLAGMGPDEEGNWSIKETGTHIIFTNDKGKTNEIEFRFEEDRLVTLMPGMAMKLSRVDAE